MKKGLTTSTPYAIITIELRKGKVKIMLVTEKKITRATIVLDEAERDHLYYARAVADCFLAELKDNDSNEMMSLATGEIIEQKDIERLKSILSAMEENPHWEIIK